MKCPKCQKEGAAECTDEVDIGVGIQKHVFGAECEHCGQMSLCNACGAWDFETHQSWCPVLKEKLDAIFESLWLKSPLSE